MLFYVRKFLTFYVFCFILDVSFSMWSTSVNGIFRGAPLTVQPALQDNLASGVQLAMDHCQKQFKWDRWNCPENVFSRRNRAFYATKESAFVSSITAAAITYVVTRNCTLGNMQNCGCNPNLNGPTSEPDWVWGGCSDFPPYGEAEAKKYLDAVETGMDLVTYTNLHNYRIGRETVRKSLRKHCKCHGMSGSCSVKSCWMQMAPFSEIAHQLRKRYDHAVRVNFASDSNGNAVIGNSVSGNTISEIPKAKTENLVYLESSPNYCQANNTTGWAGTKGRSCSRAKGKEVSPSERKSCRNLCRKCGHRVKKYKRTSEKHCNCVFKWCCEVKCEVCVETVTEHFCS